MNPHLIIRNRARFKSPVCRFVRLKFMNRVISRPDIFWANLARFERVFIRSFSDGLMWWVSYQTSYVEPIIPHKLDGMILLPLPSWYHQPTGSKALQCAIHALLQQGQWRSVQPSRQWLPTRCSEQGLTRSRTVLSHTVHVILQG